MVLDEVRAAIEEALDDVAAETPGWDVYRAAVEETARACLIRQFAAAGVYEGREQLTRRVGDSIGAALGMLWELEPRIQRQHLAQLRGSHIPAPLRRHIWSSLLGGAPAVQECAEALERARRRLGLESLDESDLAPTVFRVATELYSVRPALVASATPGSVSLVCAVLNRHHVLTGQRVMVERLVLQLAPLLHVFRLQDQAKGEEAFVRWLALLVELNKVMPRVDEVPALCDRVLEEVRRDAPELHARLAELHSASALARRPLGMLVEPWLLTAMSGFLNMSTLLWWWDQLFVSSWDALPSACAGLLIVMAPNMLRCTDREQLVELVETRPYHMRPAALASCFARWTPPAPTAAPPSVAHSRPASKASALSRSSRAPGAGSAVEGRGASRAVAAGSRVDVQKARETSSVGKEHPAAAEHPAAEPMPAGGAVGAAPSTQAVEHDGGGTAGGHVQVAQPGPGREAQSMPAEASVHEAQGAAESASGAREEG